MSLRPFRLFRDGRIFGEIALVAPLVAVHVMPGGSLLAAGRLDPVQRERHRRPRRDQREFFLSHVMVHAAAVDSATAAQHQGGDGGAVHQAVVVPVIDARADDDHGLAVRDLGVVRELARQAGDGVATDARVLFLPGGRVRTDLIVGFRIIARQSAAHAELRHEQIEGGRHRDASAVGFHVADGDAAQGNFRLGKFVIGDIHDLIVFVEEGQFGIERGVVLPVLHLEIPLAFFLAPAVADRAFGHARLFAGFIEDQQFPVAVLLVRVSLDAVGAQEASRFVNVAILFQFHQKSAVGVLLEIVGEIRNLAFFEEFLQDDVIDRHPQRRVGARLDGNPPIRIFGDLAEVGRDRDVLRPVVPRLGDEMHIRGARHAHVCAHRDDVLAVVPIGGFAYVGLVAPDFGEGGRQVGVPVVETHVDAAEQLQEARSARVRKVRHGGDRRKAEDAVGAVFLRGVEHARHNDFRHFVPGGTAETALAARLLDAIPLRFILHDGCVRFHGTFARGALFAPEIEQDAARVRILDADRAVDVPRRRDAALAAARFVGRKILFEKRIIRLLHFPGDDAVLDVHLPRTSARAVHAVRTADDVIVLPAVAVELFPLTRFRVDQILDPSHGCSSKQSV